MSTDSLSIDPAVQYPLGSLPQLTADQRVPATLEQFAVSLEHTVAEWRGVLGARNSTDLARTYRPDSWNVRQLAHHVAEAHLHGLTRLQAGLTQDGYTIAPFDQEKTLMLASAQLPVTPALDLLEATNAYWLALLRGTESVHFSREVIHSAEGPQDLWQLVTKHDWHLRHHLAQVRWALTDTALGVTDHS